MGTPSFAVPSLEQMVKDGHEVALVITQPDRPAGRGRRAASPPTKDAAVQHGLPVLQPRRLKDEGVLEAIQRANPDVIVVAAFGQILRRNVLELPRLGCLNVHASLLPRHRGAAPITAAILAGDNATGISIMLMDEGLDTGPVLAQAAEPILPTDTTESLAGRLALVGADLLSATLPRWASGEIKPQPQDDSRATYAPQLKKEDGLLDWQLPAEDLWLRTRAYRPWPAAFTHWQGRLLKVLESLPLGPVGAPLPPGRVATVDVEAARAACRYPDLLPPKGQVLVAGTGNGRLALLRLQMEGARPVTGEEFARGRREVDGAQLG